MTIAESTSHLVGQSTVIARLSAVLGGTAGAPPALVVFGQAGIGKSTLLRHVVARVADDAQVLWLAGAGSSPACTRLAAVLWPLRRHVDELPLGLQAPLRLLFDGAGSSADQSPVLADAVVALLEAGRAPIVLVVDDVDQLDPPTCELLVTVAARVVGTRVRAVLTARRRDVLGGVARSIDTIEVAPLDAASSAKLLAAQPIQPDRSVRGEIIRWSRGNPLALIEYARAYGHNGTKTFHGATMNGLAGHHPVFANQIAALPADTRRLLLVAAAATGYESVDAITRAAGYGDDFTHWQPARAAGIVDFTDDHHVAFANALIRSAAFADGDLGLQRAAHLALAASPGLKESLRAWHLAAAAPGPDETIAAALEESAVASACLGMDLELARALQRAAEMSPRRDDAARRYARAASAANLGGDPGWALALTEVPLNESSDADVAGFAALTRASILLQHGRATEAVDTIRGVLDGDRRPADAHLALALLHTAASASFYTGDLDHRRQLKKWLELTEPPRLASPLTLPFPIGVSALQRAYVAMYAETAESASTRPHGFDRAWLRPASDPSSDRARRLVAGVMAYATEHSALAAAELGGAIEDVTTLGGLRGYTFALAPLSWALLDCGRWDELANLLAEARSVGALHAAMLVDRETSCCAAQLHAFRGDVEAAAAAFERANGVTPTTGAPPNATRVALMRVSGWMAIASGDFEDAYRRFGAMFGDNADPAHFVISYRAVADIAWAAARCGRVDEVRPLIEQIGSAATVTPPTRLRLVQHQAMALVSTGSRAEQHYKLAVFDPAGEEWPLDRARARLHYGEWLRRARRPAEAKQLLGAALEVFDRLGALPLARIARSELRAAGVVSADAAPPDAMHALTAQEREIVGLAASGLTNREIADRLKLSPRTVASHLYHVYPKLGVTRRHELREFIS
ncbi:transcriptional regulator [Mycolicibacterium madagascariense]|uniref:Transcriptional regulator n=1 Tax=Mycolicibacterium madagascariense TaxID=212765 RepID=A0A7I7XB13_9MYCO|nr:LuxR C-terminal-related transcriptional regulator [Mycolicibacterium madagascariense]MCV7011384.1 helix-turn-helix transcriptional regulator [Mycolicibacterium madagascariense]BBZ26764.1 transcriptional regulator [Mycolicibacterium madagascariense]